MILSAGEGCAVGALAAVAEAAARVIGLSSGLPRICWRADERALPRRALPRRAPRGLEDMICNFDQLAWRRDKNVYY